jgi:hypothetical protein
MISSDTDESKQLSDYAADVAKNIQSKDGLVKTFAVGRLFKHLRGFSEKKLDRSDKRLIKGFFVNNRYELENSTDQDLLKLNTDNIIKIASNASDKEREDTFKRMNTEAFKNTFQKAMKAKFMQNAGEKA